MPLKTWLVAALGLGSLLLLIALSILASSRKAQDIYVQLDQLDTHHRLVETNLRGLRSDVNLSGVFVRDYLLDVARERGPGYREQLTEFREANMATLAELEKLIGRDERIESLRAKLDEYWQTFDPLFDWTPAEKILQSAGFLRREVVPRRDAVLSIALQIEELNNANIAAQKAEMSRRQEAFRRDMRRLLWQTVLLGLAVSIVVVVRLRVLEHRSEEAEGQMRELSQQLVNTQEEERRNLSRELHDHVAQVLTGLRMGLGRIERISGDSRVSVAVAECRQLVDDMFRTVRDLALGLRPSMLDDFGLQPALEWHVRDFSRRFNMDAELKIDGDVASLPDKHRTCVYRGDPGGDDQQRQARAGEGDSRRGVQPRRPAAGGGKRRRDRARPDDGQARPGPARHRRTRQGTAGLDDHRSPRGDRPGHHDQRAAAGAHRNHGGGACAYCWLTITASSGGACGDSSNQTASRSWPKPATVSKPCACARSTSPTS